MGNEVRMMAKYSMELGEMMENPLTPLFHFDYDFYCDDQLVKKKFEQKFIDHYFFYEIGCETHARWSQMLKARLNLIMPYYKQLYETELKSKNIEFLLNKDYTETFIRELDRTNQDTVNGEINNHSSQTNNGVTNHHSSITQNEEIDGLNQVTSNETNSKNSENTSTRSTNDDVTQSNNLVKALNHKESSLNDGVSNANLEQGYLTAVSQDDENSKSTLSSLTNSNDSSSSHLDETITSSTNNHSTDTRTSSLTNEKQDEVTSNDNVTSTSNQSQVSRSNGEMGERESHTIIGKGNIGTTSSAELLSKWREVLINIDQLIINECKDLFMLIY